MENLVREKRQIKTIREALGLNQSAMAENTGKHSHYGLVAKKD